MYRDYQYLYRKYRKKYRLSRHIGGTVSRPLEQLYILPCLHELGDKAGPVGYLVGPENIPSRPRHSGSPCTKWKRFSSGRESNSHGLCHSSELDPSTQTGECTWNHLLQYLHYVPSSYGTCSKANHLLLSVTDMLQNTKIVTPSPRVFIIVGHHRKLKLLFRPLSQADTGKKIGIATCSCIRMTVTAKGISTEVIFNGFPDKPDKYAYLTTGNQLGLRNERGIILPQCVIYWVRHGNSLHNEPIGIKTIDSTLTPLGIYQARQAGKAIASDISRQERTDLNIIYVASHMNRTQHTCLTIREMVQLSTNIDDKSFQLWAENFYKTTLSGPSVPSVPSNPLTDLVKRWDQFALRKLDRHYPKRRKGVPCSKQYTGDDPLDPIHADLIEKLDNPRPEAFSHT